MHFISISVYKTNKVIELWEIKKKLIKLKNQMKHISLTNMNEKIYS